MRYQQLSNVDVQSIVEEHTFALSIIVGTELRTPPSISNEQVMIVGQIRNVRLPKHTDHNAFSTLCSFIKVSALLANTLYRNLSKFCSQ